MPTKSDHYTPRCSGHELDTSAEKLGQLQPPECHYEDWPALQSSLEANGYLYLPGFWERDDVLEIRRQILEKLRDEGQLDPNSKLDEGRPAKTLKNGFNPNIAKDVPAVAELLFGSRMMAFWEGLLGEPALHFDYIWFRTMPGGSSTPPHCDIVFMGRGTKRLFTSWVPYGDIPPRMGGLAVLEGSHTKHDKLRQYLSRDVDTYCSNGPNAEAIASGEQQWEWDGRLSDDPIELQKILGGRWLTTDFRAGDALIFGMGLVHAGLENHSGRLRISSDSRYQPASEPADERWIGPNPIAHGPGGKRGKIC